MVMTAILNAIAGLGVTVMVIAPLVWAILTQHRDHPGRAQPDGGPARAPQSQSRQRRRRPRYTSAAGRA